MSVVLDDTMVDPVSDREIVNTVVNGPILAAAQWSDHAVSLRDFAAVHSTPTLIRITKGQYRNVGVAKSVHNELYLHDITTTSRVLAECVRIKRDGKRAVSASDQKYAIPFSFSGWFEVLSEDGKSAAPLANVAELARAFPHACLVRETVKAFLASDSGQLALDRGRTIATGDVLTLDRDIVATIATPKGVVRRRFLRCTDETGTTVFLPLEQRGSFSPIAGKANIAGMHNLSGLLSKFRLPIIVRLVHGPVPQRLRRSGFTAAFRLLSRYDDETAFVCPLRKDAKMVPISTREPLRVVGATNMAALAGTEECTRYANRCASMMESYLDSIHVLVTLPNEELLAKGRQELRQDHNRQGTERRPNKDIIEQEEEDVLFEEIEDIYQYVRDGGIAPAPRAKPVVKAHVKPPPVQEPLAAVKREETTNNDLADDDYWEEPIYEQLQKQRQQTPKQPAKTQQSDDKPQRRSLKQTYSLPDVSLKSSAATPPDLIANIDAQPVANLRQMYKRNDSKSCLPAHDENVPADDDDDDDDNDFPYEIAPPVPPKHYDQSELEEQIRSCSPEVTVTTPLKVNLSSKASKSKASNRNVYEEKQTIERHSSAPIIASAHSNQPLPNQLTNGFNGIARASSKSTRHHEPYVAVAQVGQARAKNVYTHKYSAPLVSRSVEHQRKKIESMFL